MAEGVEKVRTIKFSATIVRADRTYSNFASTESRNWNYYFKTFELRDFFNSLG